MRTVTQRYVVALEQKFSVSLGKDLADLLGVKEMSVSRYRSGNKGFADEVALRAADLLDLDPEVVLVEIQADRVDSPSAKKAWAEVARRLAKGKGRLKQLAMTIGAGALVTLGTFGGADTARAAGASHGSRADVSYVYLNVGIVGARSRGDRTPASQSRPPCTPAAGTSRPPSPSAGLTSF